MPQIRGIHVPKESEIDNLLLNSNFDFFQRGSSFSASGNALDRWFLGTASTPVFTIQNGGIVPNGSTNYAILRTTTNTQAWGIRQALESTIARRYFGKKVTFSVLLRRNAAFDQGVNIAIQQNTTGDTITGGTWTTLAIKNITNGEISTSAWTLFTITATVGTAAGLSVFIQQNGFSAGNPAEVYVAQCMFNEGPIAAPYRMQGENLESELAAIQRFYEKSYNPTVNPGSDPQAGISRVVRPDGSGGITVNFAVTKRATPTIAIFNPTNGTAGVRNESLGTNVAGSSTSSVGFTGFIPDYPTITAGVSYSFSWTADAEFT